MELITFNALILDGDMGDLQIATECVGCILKS